MQKEVYDFVAFLLFCGCCSNSSMTFVLRSRKMLFMLASARCEGLFSLFDVSPSAPSDEEIDWSLRKKKKKKKRQLKL